MDRLTHYCDLGLEDWEQTLFEVKSDPGGSYNVLDVARYDGEEEFDDILINIAMRIKHYEDMEEQLEKAYGECEGLLETAINSIVKHEGFNIGNPLKSRLLTDDDSDKWESWKNAEEQGKLLILPCKLGDVLYETQFNNRKWEIFPFKVNCFEVMKSHGKTRVEIHFEGTEGYALCDENGNLDEGWYFTEQEAKEALERMKE